MGVIRLIFEEGGREEEKEGRCMNGIYRLYFFLEKHKILECTK